VTISEIEREIHRLRRECELLFVQLPRFIVALAKRRHHSVQPFSELAEEHPEIRVIRTYADHVAALGALEVELRTREAEDKPPPDLTLVKVRRWHQS
jgi:hypothetical protein